MPEQYNGISPAASFNIINDLKHILLNARFNYIRGNRLLVSKKIPKHCTDCQLDGLSTLGTDCHSKTVADANTKVSTTLIVQARISRNWIVNVARACLKFRAKTKMRWPGKTTI